LRWKKNGKERFSKRKGKGENKGGIVRMLAQKNEKNDGLNTKKKEKTVRPESIKS